MSKNIEQYKPEEIAQAVMDYDAESIDAFTKLRNFAASI